MESNPKTSSRPSFFKVLIKDDFTNKLAAPRFCAKYGKFLPEITKLRSRSGETLDVKLDQETDDDDEYYFTRGWNKFVKDFPLKTFELLVFWFSIGESKFDVSVYGKDCSEREISAMDVDSDADEEVNLSNNCYNVPGKHVELQAEIGFKERNYGIQSFEAVVKNYSRFFMDIPKAFALETGIETKRAIKLQNVEGKKWVVEIPIKKEGRIRLSTGWNEFLVENELVIGSKCWFEFDATSGDLNM